MKYIFSLIFLLVASVSGFAQTNFTAVMVDTNGVVQRPTNFWTNAPLSNSIDLSTTNATGVLPVSRGGTGATNAQTALTNLSIIASATLATNSSIKIGDGAIVSSTSGRDIAIGGYSTADAGNSVALGHSANSEGSGAVALGGGAKALANNTVQLGSGTISSINSGNIQAFGWGLVNSNEWSAVANSSTQGRYVMTNTSGISATNIIIGYNGTNYVTNTITVINGIIIGWTQ